jgi:uncharacterized protein
VPTEGDSQDPHGESGFRAGDAHRCFWQTVALLVVFNVGRAFGLLGPLALSAVLLMLVLAVIARRQHANAYDLGLRRRDTRAGALYGAGAFGVVLAVLLVTAAVPATNGFLHDSRADISGGHLLYQVLVSELLLTAIPEEFAFRGVLLGSALRLWGSRGATLVTSLLFGLWHVAPTLHTMSDNNAVKGAPSAAVVLGAVVVTFGAGVLFCWLRLRSRSLLAPVIAHVATNALALTVAWFAVH